MEGLFFSVTLKACWLNKKNTQALDRAILVKLPRFGKNPSYFVYSVFLKVIIPVDKDKLVGFY